MGITITTKGNWDKTTRYLNQVKNADITRILNKYGQKGVDALSAATPVDSSKTANSWSYEIVTRKGYHSIRWHNSNIVDGQLIAILIQYGHGTGTGGYVQGRDYIMPALRSIFDQIAEEAWKEVTR